MYLALFFFFSACDQIGMGIAALFGPQTPPLASFVQSVASVLEIPHIEARPDLRPSPPGMLIATRYAYRHQVSLMIATRYANNDIKARPDL